jgi:pentafunctional AROM polypeptide
MKVQSDFHHVRRISSIALAMGERGKLSRVMNQVLTPVTHPALPSIAAPGQLSVRQILDLRLTLGMLSEKWFCLIGYPIKLSPSPSMHNAAFQKLQLPLNVIV